MKRLMYVALVFSLSGCYVYAPSSEPIPEMGREIRASLVDPKDLSSGNTIIRDVTRVDGTLYGTNADTLVIWSKWLHGRGDRYFADGEVHPFVRGELESLEVRKFNAARTALASVLGIGAGLSLFAFTADLGGGVDGEPDPGDTQSQVATPFRGVPSIR